MKTAKVALTQNRTDHMSVTIRDLLVTFCDLLSNKECSSGLWHVLAQIHGKLIEYMCIVIIYQCMKIITGYIKYEHMDATLTHLPNWELEFHANLVIADLMKP